MPKEVNPVLKWMFLGPRNSYTAVHNDVFNTSFWNILVYGKKLWVFFSPTQSETIKTGIDLFDPSYHTFLIKTKPLIICQNAGDLLYGPSNWMHQVVNLQTSLAITENYVNQNNYQDVLKRLAQAKHDSENTYYTILKFLAERNLTNGEKK